MIYPRRGSLADELFRLSEAEMQRWQPSEEGMQRVELREEELRARKEPVETGEVRLRKDVVTEEQSIDVPVTREEVVIERRPAGDREATTANIGEGEEVRIPLMEEQVNVEKRAVVKEEVSLGKRKVQEIQEVSDTVRREEARIEGRGDVRMAETGGTGTEAWRGNERRYHDDASYAGPERRLATR